MLYFNLSSARQNRIGEYKKWQSVRCRLTASKFIKVLTRHSQYIKIAVFINIQFLIPEQIVYYLSFLYFFGFLRNSYYYQNPRLLAIVFSFIFTFFECIKFYFRYGSRCLPFAFVFFERLHFSVQGLQIQRSCLFLVNSLLVKHHMRFEFLVQHSR